MDDKFASSEKLQGFGGIGMTNEIRFVFDANFNTLNSSDMPYSITEENLAMRLDWRRHVDVSAYR